MFSWPVCVEYRAGTSQFLAAMAGLHPERRGPWSQVTPARAQFGWLAARSSVVQQGALRDFEAALTTGLASWPSVGLAWVGRFMAISHGPRPAPRQPRGPPSRDPRNPDSPGPGGCQGLSQWRCIFESSRTHVLELLVRLVRLVLRRVPRPRPSWDGRHPRLNLPYVRRSRPWRVVMKNPSRSGLV